MVLPKTGHDTAADGAQVFANAVLLALVNKELLDARKRKSGKSSPVVAVPPEGGITKNRTRTEDNTADCVQNWGSQSA